MKAGEAGRGPSEWEGAIILAIIALVATAPWWLPYLRMLLWAMDPFRR